MELHHSVLAERCGHRAKASDEHEVHPHHLQSDEPEGDGEFGPEVTPLRGVDQGEHQRPATTAI
jgi:hypothetical protein